MLYLFSFIGFADIISIFINNKILLILHFKRSVHYWFPQIQFL